MNNQNITVLTNNNYIILDKFKGYEMVEKITFDNLMLLVENFKSKIIVFNETFYYFSESEREKILILLKMRKINFVNITGDIEQTLLSDYIYVMDDDKLIMEGHTKSVLKEEKILKKLGFGLPFIVDLSIQLKCYNILDDIYYDMESLVDKLWN